MKTLRAALIASVLLAVATSVSVAAQQSAAVQTAAKPMTVDTTMGDLLDNAPARAVLKRELPALFAKPGIEQAHGLTLRELARYTPAILTDAKLAEIDAELARTPDAVEPAHPRTAMDPWSAFDLQTVPLWNGPAPGAKGDQPADKPMLTIIRPDGAKPSGTAVIVAPGGGYRNLATGHEGREVGDWFASHGVTAFVLRYRLTTYGYMFPAQLLDAQRAIRWVRFHSQDYNIDPKRIGMIGFSAGGHLTAMTETLFDNGNAKAADPVDRMSSRPDFAILAYPLIRYDNTAEKITGLVGPHPDAAVLKQVSPAQNVTAETPPTFIYQTSTDELVIADNATLFYNALLAAKVPVEMHIFARGHHGTGFGGSDPALSVWPSLLQTWLEDEGFLGDTDAGAATTH